MNADDGLQSPACLQRTSAAFVAFIVAAISRHFKRDGMRSAPHNMNVRPASLDMKDNRTLVPNQPKMTFQSFNRFDPAPPVHAGGFA